MVLTSIRDLTGLQGEITLYDYVYLVVDALNEQEDYWEQLEGHIKEFRPNTQEKLRILTTSRDTQGQAQVYIECNRCGEENLKIFYRCTTCFSRGICFDLCQDCKDENGVCPQGPTHVLRLPSHMELDVEASHEDLKNYIRYSIKKEMGKRSNGGRKLVC